MSTSTSGINHATIREQSTRFIDPVKVRQALRLVHCLQKERGASCAYYASRHEPNIVQSMERARVDSDRSIQMMLSGRGELKVHSTLVKIRKMVQVADLTKRNNQHEDHDNRNGTNGEAAAAIAQQNNAEKTRSISCHRILVCFNALISSVVHDYFMEKISLQERSMHLRRENSGGKLGGDFYRDGGDRGGKPWQRKGGGASSASSNKGHNRAKSTGDFCFFSEADALACNNHNHNHNHPQKKKIRNTNSMLAWGTVGSAPGTIDEVPIPNTQPPEALPPYGAPPATSAAVGTEDAVPLNDSHQHGVGSSPRRLSRSGSFDSNQNQHVHFHDATDDPAIVLTRLLNLLACFVKLKESTGVERAVLSSLVVSGKEDSLLLSDLVLEVENQRRLLDKLKKLPFGSLRNLVAELVEMSQPLRDLQQKILEDFDLDGIIVRDPEQDVTAIWDLITVYIDKLHSLELLIIEEIEYCLPQVEYSNTQDRQKKHQSHLIESDFVANLFGAKSSAEDIREKLENMPAEEIKSMLIKGLIPDDTDLSTSHHPHDFSIATVDGIIDDPLLMLPDLPASKEWEIDLYELKFLKRIGEGAAGTTYLANWTGLKVAVKVASITETGLDGWRTEVQALQKLHHPNIIRLLGSVYHPNPLTFCLVLEYCSAGELTDVLRVPTAPDFFFHVATSIAKGVAYLHSRGIMHRDIKPSNILIDGNARTGNFQVKVSDFGVAADTSVIGDRTAETGTYRWMAPEVIRHEIYSNMADVYSYAVVLWQLITREDPYMNVSQIEAAGKVALERARPPLPHDTPRLIAEVLETLWSENPDYRWPFEAVCKRLPETQSKLSAVETKWLDAPLGHPVYYPRDDSESDDNAHHQVAPALINRFNKEEKKGKEDKKKSGFFKIKMFGR